MEKFRITKNSYARWSETSASIMRGSIWVLSSVRPQRAGASLWLTLRDAGGRHHNEEKRSYPLAAGYCEVTV